MFRSALLSLIFLFLFSCGGGSKNWSKSALVQDLDAPTVTSSVQSGTYNSPQQLVLSCDDGDGSGCESIHFLRNSGTLSKKSQKYTAPLEIETSTVLSFIAYDAAGNASEVNRVLIQIVETAIPVDVIPGGGSFWGVTIPKVKIPGIPPTVDVSIKGGAYANPVELTFSCVAAGGIGCSVYYSLDGSPPSSQSAKANSPILISDSRLVQYIAIDQNGLESGVKSERYTIDINPPLVSINRASDTFNRPQSIVISCTDFSQGSGCGSIYYTLDGSQPGVSKVRYSHPVFISRNAVLNAIAIDRVGNKSRVVSRSFQFDFKAPRLLSSFPSKQSQSFPAFLNPELNFTEALDISTVNENNVLLESVTGASVSFSIVPDETSKKVTLKLLKPLVMGQLYSIRLINIQDLAGNFLPNMLIPFRAANVSQEVGYVDGKLNAVNEWSFDDVLHLPLSRQNTLAGVDNAWFTDDDETASKRVFEYAANNDLLNTVTYTSAGIDGIWGDADDPVASYFSYIYSAGSSAPIMRYEYVGSGIDGIWFNADDIVGTKADNEYDANGILSRIVEFATAGTDGIWGTADDLISGYWDFSLDEKNNLRVVFYSAPGADEQWFSVDDVVAEYDVYIWNESFKTMNRKQFDSAGPDASWFTSDDVSSKEIIIKLPAVDAFNPLFFY